MSDVSKPAYHYRTHLPGGSDPIPAEPQWAVKLFSDDPTQGVTVVGDSRFVFTVPKRMNGWFIVDVELGLGTEDSDDTEVQLRAVDNGGVDVLATPITIPSGDHHSGNGIADIEQAGDIDQVSTGDRIAVDVDSGSDGTGLHIYVWLAYERQV